MKSAVREVNHLYYKPFALCEGTLRGVGDFCDQEGCAETATHTYSIKHGYDSDGEEKEKPYRHIRRFCDRHSTRGNSRLDDCDENYEVLEGGNPSPVQGGDTSMAKVIFI